MAAPLSDILLMPNPCDKGLLHFKGKDIDVFLSRFEYHADRACLTEVQRCEFLRLYFSKKEMKFLDILEGFQCRNWSKLTALLGVKLTPSTSYHPQTDSQTECVNQEIEVYLRVFVSHRQDDLADWLPLVEFAYNNKVHLSGHIQDWECM